MCLRWMIVASSLVLVNAAGAGSPAPGAAALQPASTAPISPDALDTLLGPIALYPDPLILQIIQCSQSPFEVKQVSEWLTQNSTLKGTALQDAASKQGFDASFVALVLFPQVVHMMADQPDWTRRVGEAFANDKNAVFASIQRLRTQAQVMGNLQSNQQQNVQTVSTSTGQQVIVVQPANPQVVYVPQYNPQVVYTQPAPTTVVQDNSGTAAAAGLVGFAAGVIVGAAADNDNDHYYYACGGWGYHGAALCSEGWDSYYQNRQNMANDYYQHRENMANDYYQNRQNMAGQRGDNQQQRQEWSSQNQQQRQEWAAQNQQQWAASSAQNQYARAQSASAMENTAQSRGYFQDRSESAASQNSAFSNYQRGDSERASSERGYGSLNSSGSGGENRGGGEGRSWSGGGSRGGGRRR
ncbi:MAG: DUF3300 domain-containing protein [Phycisphaerales bacterium]|nr:DUF3300 domain-containing protein [Phycisphaerales bacterium]